MRCLSPARRLVLWATALLLLSALTASAGSSEPVQLREIDGGPGYFGRFSNALPSDPTYFPIGVWLESVTSQADVERDKDAGLNLYVLLTSNSNLSLVQRNGMRAILQESEWRDNQVASDSPAVSGWGLPDEIDMQQGPGRGYSTLNDILAKLPNDGRLRYNNYGKGVMFWETSDQAGRFVNEFQHVVSSDVYWFTDPHVSGRSEGGSLLNSGRPLTAAQTRRAANYGYAVDHMRRLARGSKPIWNFVEVGWPFTETEGQGARSILPAEVTAAVWHSIIAGARGIIYFNHSFGGPDQSQHCLREPKYGAVRAAVKSTNQLITRLAPVLNAPFADGFVSASSSVRAMAKLHDGKHYVFAGSRENVASRASFRLAGVESGSAAVIGENRTISVSNSQFTDDFADGNAIHIYRIDKR